MTKKITRKKPAPRMNPIFCWALVASDDGTMVLTEDRRFLAIVPDEKVAKALSKRTTRKSRVAKIAITEID